LSRSCRLFHQATTAPATEHRRYSSLFVSRRIFIFIACISSPSSLHPYVKSHSFASYPSLKTIPILLFPVLPFTSIRIKQLISTCRRSCHIISCSMQEVNLPYTIQGLLLFDSAINWQDGHTVSFWYGEVDRPQRHKGTGILCGRYQFATHVLSCPVLKNK